MKESEIGRRFLDKKEEMSPDLMLRIRFKTEQEGGRSTNIKGRYYGCPLVVDESAFECRLLLDEAELELGEVYDIPVKLMNRSEARQKLRLRQVIVLWEGKKIGEGRVIEFL